MLYAYRINEITEFHVLCQNLKAHQESNKQAMH